MLMIKSSFLMEAVMFSLYEISYIGHVCFYLGNSHCCFLVRLLRRLRLDLRWRSRRLRSCRERVRFFHMLPQVEHIGDFLGAQLALHRSRLCMQDFDVSL